MHEAQRVRRGVEVADAEHRRVVAFELALRCSSSGASAWHGSHQEAQKLSTHDLAAKRRERALAVAVSSGSVRVAVRRRRRLPLRYRSSSVRLADCAGSRRRSAAPTTACRPKAGGEIVENRLKGQRESGLVAPGVEPVGGVISTPCGDSSVGRARASQARGRGFETRSPLVVLRRISPSTQIERRRVRNSGTQPSSD